MQIIILQNIEYIFLYELDFCKSHQTKFEYKSDSKGKSPYKIFTFN